MHLKTRFFLAPLLAISPAVLADVPPCEQSYLDGIELFEQGKYEQAAKEFGMAISLSPDPDASDDYTPYMYMAAAHFQLGNHKTARDLLVQSQIYGDVTESERGQALIGQYAEAIMAADPVDQDPDAGWSQTPVATVAGGLSDLEAESIRARVLKRCALSSDVEENKLPWYFHYLLGLEYNSEGDSSRALESFQLGANIRESSARNKRLYGMWYMDYLPYYQIARIQADQGNWERAFEALQLSEEAGEFSPDDKDFERFDSLNKLVQANLDYADS